MRRGAEVWRPTYEDDDVEIVDCPLCGSGDADELAEEWTLVVAQCRRCGLAYVRRRVVSPEWSYRADRDAMLEKYGAVIRGEREHDRQPNYEQIADRLERLRPERGRLLDVGAHIGFFLRTAKRRGWEVVGVEQSPELAQLARDEMGLDVRTGYFHEHAFDGEFDAVTFLDVLEHVPDPVETLALARRAARPGGLVLAKVPHLRWNLLKHRALKRVAGDSLDAFDAREHLIQFTDRTLEEAFRRAGLEPVELFVPRPVQTRGAPVRAVRAAAHNAARAWLRARGAAPPLAPDLCLIARRT